MMDDWSATSFADPPTSNLYDDEAPGEEAHIDDSFTGFGLSRRPGGNGPSGQLAAWSSSASDDAEDDYAAGLMEERAARSSLEEVDARFYAMDEGGAGQESGPAFPAGFRDSIVPLGLLATVEQPAPAAAPLRTGTAERPEEAEFARAVEGQMQVDVFGVLQRFEAICSERMMDLLPDVELDVGATVATSLEAMRAHHDFRLLKNERDTWLLIHALYKDRLLHGTAAAAASDERQRLLQLCPKQIKRELRERNRLFREAQIVVKWLEQLARLDGVPTYRIDGGWPRTLRFLQSSDSGKRRTELVSHLDPDATIRQDRSIAEEDADDEQRLLHVVWGLLRAGAKKQALEFCRLSGQHWRAASLSATLSTDPLLLAEGDEHQRQHDGAASSDAFRLWQLACHAISNHEEDRLSKHERAIYALMCGNTEQITPVCHSWEDHLWAHMKGLLHDLLHAELQLRNPRSSLAEDLTDGEQVRQRVEQIFDGLLKSDVLAIRQAVNDPYHIVQTHLILNSEESLLDDIAAWVLPHQGGAQCPPALLRFGAHLGLFLRQVRGTCSQADDLIEAYVRHLVRTRQTALVALYTSKLTLPAAQVEIYADFLRGITEREERERCLELADRAGLNVNAITKRVVELVGAAPLPLPASSETANDTSVLLLAKPSVITPEEDAAIRAIEWLTFDPDQRIDALTHANALARKFIGADRYGALERLLRALPRDSIRVVKRRWALRKNPGEEDAVREYACYQYLSSARSAYEEWRAHEQACPKAPDAPPPAAGAPASAQIVYTNRVKSYAEDMRRWQLEAWGKAEAAMHALYALLLFPNGWLHDLRVHDRHHRPDEEQEDSSATALRREELVELRRKVVPEVFFMSHTVLFANKQYQDSVELADLLADEYHQYYRAFTQEQLQQFLALVRKSARQVLDEQQDALAY